MDKELEEKCLLTLKEREQTLQNGLNVKRWWANEATIMDMLLEAQLTKAIPIVAEDIKKGLETMGIAPPHNYEHYFNEVGQRERKHLLLGCKGCSWEAFWERYKEGK